MLEQEKGERNSPHEENVVTETIYDELSPTPIPHPSVTRLRILTEFWSEGEPRKNGAMG